MKVSVLIPAYNAEKYISSTLESVIKQTLNDIEIIIVNDGSTDNTENVIKDYLNTNSNIRYYYQENSGVAVTRNNLLKYANGEYIAFLDADDTIGEDMYMKMYKTAISKNADIVVCNFNEVHDDFTIKKKGYFELDKSADLLISPCLWNKLFKKSLFENVSFPMVTIGEDMFVTIKLINNSKKIEYIDDYFYNYYKRENSIMNQKKFKSYWSDIFKIFELLESEIVDYDILEYLFIQHILRDSSIKYMYYKEGINELNRINTLAHTKYSNYRDNKYFKLQNVRYKIICNLLYNRKYNVVKLIRKLLNSDR